MKYIKLAILSFILLFIIVTIISLFMPSHVKIMKVRNMKTQPDSLWKVIDDFKTWQQWNTLLPDIEKQEPVYLKNELKTKNLTVKWIGDPHPYSRFAVIQPATRKPMLSGWKVKKVDELDSLMVQWLIDIQLRWYPWEKFAGMLYEKSYGDKLEEGLKMLEQFLDK